MRIIPARAGFTANTNTSSWGRRDHPRSRGVYCDWPGCKERLDGSSPLARGLRGLSLRIYRESRIIPARAGFTWRNWATAPNRSDHPRSRGVYGPGVVSRPATGGSSPLARGLQRIDFPEECDDRIIPARAGFTSTRRRRGGGHSDHPRSRGVYIALEIQVKPVLGSSPLARGLLGGIVGLNGQAGIIPARAGFTERMNEDKRTSSDHPRSRGVY